MLKPLAEMPPDLQRHMRYPEDIFRVQSAVFQQYHMTNPAVFYNKEDQWQMPTLDVGGNPVPMQPYYTIMRLPGQQEPEFLQMLPFTPRLKENLAAWMVARSDPAHYGKLLVFQFPKQKIIYGPKQVNGRINQDQVISQNVTLWSQTGNSVIWGTLLVIPIEESLLYVRPLYLRSAEGRIPELKRVIVAYQSQIVMAETLVEALGEDLRAGGRQGAGARSAGQHRDVGHAHRAGHRRAAPGCRPSSSGRRAGDRRDRAGLRRRAAAARQPRRQRTTRRRPRALR